MTTFWHDFTIAEVFGNKAVRDTYRRAFRHWKHDFQFLTELVMVLNHKIWQHYDNKNMALAELYDELWREADAWCVENLKGDELTYFYKTLD